MDMTYIICKGKLRLCQILSTITYNDYNMIGDILNCKFYDGGIKDYFVTNQV